MTDLTKGIIEIAGVQITPDTSLEQFEKENKNNGVLFEKEVLSESVTLFLLNGWACRLPNTHFDTTKHREFILNGMTFLNIVVLFRNNRIEKIELNSKLQSYAFDKEGKRIYSPEKEKECFQALCDWSKKCWGEPNNDPRLSVCWNCGWGCFRPTPLSSRGSDTSIFLVEYGRNYAL